MGRLTRDRNGGPMLSVALVVNSRSAPKGGRVSIESLARVSIESRTRVGREFGRGRKSPAKPRGLTSRNARPAAHAPRATSAAPALPGLAARTAPTSERAALNVMATERRHGLEARCLSLGNSMKDAENAARIDHEDSITRQCGLAATRKCAKARRAAWAAQSVEQRIFNPRVGGSSRSTLTVTRGGVAKRVSGGRTGLGSSGAQSALYASANALCAESLQRLLQTAHRLNRLRGAFGRDLRPAAAQHGPAGELLHGRVQGRAALGTLEARLEIVEGHLSTLTEGSKSARVNHHRAEFGSEIALVRRADGTKALSCEART